MKVATDIAGVLFITIYLTCTLVVHTALPGTFSLTAVNITVYIVHPTTLARQKDIMDLLYVDFIDINPIYITLTCG